MMEALANKIAILIVGPTAIGKSTLMNEIMQIDNEFSRVGGFTTRSKRPNDEPRLYRYISNEEVAALAKACVIVQSATHPTTGVIYGTEITDYTRKFNMKDVMASAVDEFRALPFEKTVTISLTSSPHQWKEWLLARYPTPSPERTKRLEESRRSIHWSMGQGEQQYWVLNETGARQKVAEHIIAIARGKISSLPNLENDAANILSLIDTMLLEEELS